MGVFCQTYNPAIQCQQHEEFPSTVEPCILEQIDYLLGPCRGQTDDLINKR